MNDKILIVDDQLGIRILLKEILQKEGYQIFQASNGHQALAITKEISPDLVLLDMKIPGMDGLEILERMKQLNEKIKVIIMTAYGDQKMMDRSKQLGALTHFPKPFDIEELRSTVRKYMPSKVDS